MGKGSYYANPLENEPYTDPAIIEKWSVAVRLSLRFRAGGTNYFKRRALVTLKGGYELLKRRVRVTKTEGPSFTFNIYFLLPL